MAVRNKVYLKNYTNSFRRREPIIHELDEKVIVGTFVQNFKDFLKNSSLHGLKYTANGKLTIFERMFFVIIFLTLLVCSGYFISDIYMKWAETPMIISTAPQSVYITKIPFPAVTICSLNQALKSKVDNLNKNSVEYMYLENLCGNLTEKGSYKESGGNWLDFQDFVLNVSQPCEEMIIFCKFSAEIRKCEKLFRPILTDDGLCCTFNSIDNQFLVFNYNKTEDILTEDYFPDETAIDWSPETGYPADLPPKFYPRRSKGTGTSSGLTLVLNTSLNEYYCTTTNSVGFKVLIHNPIEHPKLANFGFLIGSGRENRVTIKPEIQSASDSIRHAKITTRQCIFLNEANLSYYRIYSRINCERECESRLVQEKCGCVLYFLPLLSFDWVICNPSRNSCARDVLEKIEQQEHKDSNCGRCYASCSELSFSQMISSSKITRNNFSSRDYYPSVKMETEEDISIVHFYYSTNFFRRSQKDMFFTFTDFLSNTGGLLGLFMGFSMFSVIEILYFFTIRPSCALRVKAKGISEQRNYIKKNIKTVNPRWEVTNLAFRKKATNSNSIYLKNQNAKYKSTTSKINVSYEEGRFPYYN